MDERASDATTAFSIPSKFLYDSVVGISRNQHIISRGVGIGDCRCCSSGCKYHEHPNDEERLATCGATAEDLLLKFEGENHSDVEDENKEDADEMQAMSSNTEDLDQTLTGVMQHSEAIDNQEAFKEAMNIEVVENSNIEPEQSDQREAGSDGFGGKRKAESEDESVAKKPKQEAGL